jgi:transposase-like protein
MLNVHEGPDRQVPETEVPEKPSRRRFTAEYKLRILQAADSCNGPGEIGALLRREGLYASHLSSWRRQRDAGSLSALRSRKRGRKADPDAQLRKQVAKLERENARLRRKLAQAETVIEVQKKVSGLLGIPLGTDGADETK